MGRSGVSHRDLLPPGADSAHSWTAIHSVMVVVMCTSPCIYFFIHRNSAVATSTYCVAE
jgi:hypothetical protein